MRSDGEKAYFKPDWDDTLLYIACRYAVGVELFSQLFSVSGVDTHGVLSCDIFFASVVSPECAAGTGGIAAEQGKQKHGFFV